MIASSRVLLLVLSAAVLALAGSSARGEDAAAENRGWAYTVRVVRVDTTTPEVAEQPWDVGDLTTAPWATLLKTLKGRGTTTLLVDQSVTAVGGGEVVIEQQRDQQIRQFQSEDRSVERWQGSILRSGVKATLQMGAGDVLRYGLQVQWVLAPRPEDLRASLFTATWSGGRHDAAGQTIVLPYREQVEYLDGEKRGVEIYAFVTARPLP